MAITRSLHTALSAAGVGSDLTMHLYGTSIAAIDAARDAHIERSNRAVELYREREKVRDDVQRIPEHNKAEAQAAGLRGESVDHDALRQRRVSLIEREAWLDLDYDAAVAARDAARQDYLTAVRDNAEQLMRVAAKQHSAAEVKLQTARAMLADAGAVLDVTVYLFTLGAQAAEAPGYVNLRAPGPSTASDPIDDSSVPSVWLGLADEPLERGLAWASRWLAHEKTVLGPRRRGESTPESEAADAADRARAEAEHAVAEAAARFAVE